jgi:hypothetical protein
VVVVVSAIAAWWRFVLPRITSDRAISLDDWQPGLETLAIAGGAYLLVHLSRAMQMQRLSHDSIGKSVGRILSTVQLIPQVDQKTLEARIISLPSPFQSLARLQQQDLIGAVQDMDRGWVFKPFLTPSRELAKVFQAILAQASGYLQAVTVAEFWDYKAMGHRLVRQEYIKANLDRAKLGLKVKRFVLGRKPLLDVDGGLREALVELMDAEEELVSTGSAGCLESYYIPSGLLQREFRFQNFGIWQDEEGARLFVSIKYLSSLAVAEASEVPPSQSIIEGITLGRADRLDAEHRSMLEDLDACLQQLARIVRMHPETRIKPGTFKRRASIRPICSTPPTGVLTLTKGGTRQEGLRVLVRDYDYDPNRGIVGLGLQWDRNEPEVPDGDTAVFKLREGFELFRLAPGAAFPTQFRVAWSGSALGRDNRRFSGWGLQVATHV